MNAADRQRLAERQDNERRRLETAALLALLLVTDETRRHALAAWKLGRDPAADASATLLGTARVRGLSDRLAPLMLAGWQFGIARTLMNAQAAGVRGVGDVADLGRDTSGALLARFSQLARAVVSPIADRITQRLSQAFLLAPPKTATEAQALIRGELAAEGFARPTQDQPIAAYGLQRLIDQEVGSQYLDGLGTALYEGRVQQRLYSLQYAAVIDARTTAICRAYDWIVLPAWDPWWSTHWPLNHWNCRATIVPVWDVGGNLPQYTEHLPSIEPMPGFGIAPFATGQRPPIVA